MLTLFLALILFFEPATARSNHLMGHSIEVFEHEGDEMILQRRTMVLKGIRTASHRFPDLGSILSEVIVIRNPDHRRRILRIRKTPSGDYLADLFLNRRPKIEYGARNIFEKYETIPVVPVVRRITMQGVVLIDPSQSLHLPYAHQIESEDLVEASWRLFEEQFYGQRYPNRVKLDSGEQVTLFDYLSDDDVASYQKWAEQIGERNQRRKLLNALAKFRRNLESHLLLSLIESGQVDSSFRNKVPIIEDPLTEILNKTLSLFFSNSHQKIRKTATWQDEPKIGEVSGVLQLSNDPDLDTLLQLSLDTPVRSDLVADQRILRSYLKTARILLAHGPLTYVAQADRHLKKKEDARIPMFMEWLLKGSANPDIERIVSEIEFIFHEGRFETALAARNKLESMGVHDGFIPGPLDLGKVKDMITPTTPIETVKHCARVHNRLQILLTRDPFFLFDERLYSVAAVRLFIFSALKESNPALQERYLASLDHAYESLFSEGGLDAERVLIEILALQPRQTRLQAFRIFSTDPDFTDLANLLSRYFYISAPMEFGQAVAQTQALSLLTLADRIAELGDQESSQLILFTLIEHILQDLSLIPPRGSLLFAYEALTGRHGLTDQALSLEERAQSIAAIVHAGVGIQKIKGPKALQILTRLANLSPSEVRLAQSVYDVYDSHGLGHILHFGALRRWSRGLAASLSTLSETIQSFQESDAWVQGEEPGQALVEHY